MAMVQPAVWLAVIANVATAAAAPPTNGSAYYPELVGCFEEVGGNRHNGEWTLAPAALLPGAGFAPEECAAACHGYVFAAIRPGAACACGNSFAAAQSRDIRDTGSCAAAGHVAVHRLVHARSCADLVGVYAADGVYSIQPLPEEPPVAVWCDLTTYAPLVLPWPCAAARMLPRRVCLPLAPHGSRRPARWAPARRPCARAPTFWRQPCS